MTVECWKVPALQGILIGKRAFGAVAKLSDDVSAYAQYSDGKDPVNANIFLVNSGVKISI